MRRSLTMAAIGLLLTATACAAGPEPDTAQVASAEGAKTAEPGRVCTRERPAGSNVAVRVCRSAAEVRQAQEAASRVTSGMGDGGSVQSRADN